MITILGSGKCSFKKESISDIPKDKGDQHIDSTIIAYFLSKNLDLSQILELMTFYEDKMSLCWLNILLLSLFPF